MPVLMAMVVMTGCTSAPQAARDPEVAAAPSSVQSVTSSSSGAESTTSVAATCDPVAQGSAGVPTAADEPLLIVRYSSYWGYSRRYAPALVIYRSGAVAVARFGGNDGTDARSGDGSPSPFRSYLGGRFSPCAVDRLVAEFEVLDDADLGETGVADCTEIEVQRFDPSTRSLAGEIYLDGFGCEERLRKRLPHGATEEQRAQRAARDQLVDWVDRAGRLQGGRGLPMNDVLVVNSGHWYPDPVRNTTLTTWTTQALDPQQGCLCLSGSAATEALALVRTAITANPGVSYDSYVYTAAWLVGGQQRRFAVMIAPPAVP
ncbi:MAG: hypothetical protein WKF57_11320 [Nakamurella sp.]